MDRVVPMLSIVFSCMPFTISGQTRTLTKYTSWLFSSPVISQSNNLGETDRLIRDKVRKCLSAGLRVTLTVGELPRQRRWGLALPTLRKQLLQAAKGIRPDEWDRVVVAYEPVWAVGEGATPCSSREAQRIAAYLRGLIARHVRADAAAACTLTYTGSVNEANAAEYASLNDVEGFVVGRAGLDMTKLRSIIRTLANSQYD